MSGEGSTLPAARAAVASDRAIERSDVLAYLQRRRDNAAEVAKWSRRQHDVEPFADDRRRQLEVMIEELRAGLHEGEAAMPRAASGAYPFRDHRTLAELGAETGEA